tara:strand:- start:10541 stop:11293 length:753 start_codon:yes stop_codon:yes gene_type:complete
MASLKHIPSEKRIIFLKEFTKEIILNIIKKRIKEERINQERIKQKILSPIQELKETFPSHHFHPTYPSQKQESKKINLELTNQKKVVDILELRRPIIHRAVRKIPLQKLQSPQQQTIQPFQKSREIKPISPRVRALKEIKPEPKPRPEGFALGKIEQLLKDNSVQSIECPGPQKNLLIKKLDKIKATRINLNQKEITEVLYSFAKQAKIPIVGGILKAAVGDMVISAVISEFVGSRFIINKITPYSLIQR